jgi:cytochrome c oxidase cbb3-type subunit III
MFLSPIALAFIAMNAAAADPDIADGETTYTTFCVACHGADGTGPIGANFVAEPERLAKPDAELDAAIANGVQTTKGVMPPFGQIVDAEERANVIAYLRSRFGTEPKDASETTEPTKPLTEVKK